jgi:hypothetical protein
MPTEITAAKRIVLRFSEGSFSFNKIDYTADDTALFGLAQGLNAFQADTPESILLVVKTQLVV